jgi:formylglycine-generating enzyme required for sulfatase activity
MSLETTLIPGGAFLMGSSRGRPDEQPVRAVSVSAFRLGLTPVTNAQYAPFVADGRAVPPPFWKDAAFAAPDLPVVGVTWFEAVAYAKWLGERLGGCWRLPTEAEWERAMRGGLEGAPTPWGEALPPGEVPEGSIAGPWAVGRGTRNGFGLLDPGTVVHEWCLDRYGPYPGPGEPVYSTLDDEVLRRSSRGGSWRHRQRWSPPSARSSLPPEMRYADYGFRVLREGADSGGPAGPPTTPPPHDKQ